MVFIFNSLLFTMNIQDYIYRRSGNNGLAQQLQMAILEGNKPFF